MDAQFGTSGRLEPRAVHSHRRKVVDMLLTLLLPCFLLGCVAGLRSLTAPAVVCWAAHFGWLHLAGTKLAFMDHPGMLILFTLLAVVELIGDKLPRTPARTAPPGVIARLGLGGLCGAALPANA